MNDERNVDQEAAAELLRAIRTVPDFPKKGILFYDITTLLADARALHLAVDLMAANHVGRDIDLVVGIEARGFTFGAALAYKLCKGLVLVRKKGKLPAETRGASYALEYGTNEIEMHRDAVPPGARVLVVDDLLATGGTAAAAVDLVRQSGGNVVECAFLVELESLGGRARLQGCPVVSLVRCP